jgi:hypothetical protein
VAYANQSAIDFSNKISNTSLVTEPIADSKPRLMVFTGWFRSEVVNVGALKILIIWSKL